MRKAGTAYLRLLFIVDLEFSVRWIIDFIPRYAFLALWTRYIKMKDRVHEICTL